MNRTIKIGKYEYDTLDMALAAFKKTSDEHLKEAAQHRYFSPESKGRKRTAMHKRPKDNKNRR